jgi:hypothetical protein
METPARTWKQLPERRKEIGLKILSVIHYWRGVHVLTYENAAKAKWLLQP